MNLQNDEYYKHLLEDYFQCTHGTKLFRAFVTLDKTTDEFKSDMPYNKLSERLNNELNHILTLIPDDAKMLDKDEYIGLTTSGVADMNPSVIHPVLKHTDGTATISMCAYSAEGLIKQKTGRKAMKQLEDYFGSTGMEHL